MPIAKAAVRVEEDTFDLSAEAAERREVSDGPKVLRPVVWGRVAAK